MFDQDVTALCGSDGKPLIQRCRQHKIRNVTGRLPDRLRQVTERRMRQASLREGMAETLTILRLGVPSAAVGTAR